MFPTTLTIHIPNTIIQQNNNNNNTNNNNNNDRKEALQQRLSTEFNKQSSCAEFPINVQYQPWNNGKWIIINGHTAEDISFFINLLFIYFKLR